MSNRVVRKVKNESQSSHVAVSKDIPEDDASSEDEAEVEVKAQFNPFSLLDDEAKEDDECEENTAQNISTPAKTSQAKSSQPSSAKKKVCSKNSKSKSKASKSKNGAAQEPLAEDDFDALLEQLKQEKLSDLPHTHSTHASTTNRRDPLYIDMRNFNAESEMRQLFGANPSSAVNANILRRLPHHLKRGILVQPNPHWPPLVRLGLTMELNEHGYFYLKFSPQYEAVQQLFEMSVATHSVDQIQMLLMDNPYHMEALLLVSEMEQMQDSVGPAADLVERILYVVEAVSHPKFKWSTRDCLMKYDHMENRAFFIALFRRLCFLGRKTCYRAAFEFNKALLNLNPDEDPLCAALSFDFYALKCEAYSLLLQYAKEWPKPYPNLAFSCALAEFHLAQEKPEDATLQESADKRLQDALMRFPGMLPLLLDKCGVSPDEAVHRSEFFNSHSVAAESATLSLLQNVYATICYPLWKTPNVLEWLERNVHSVLQRIGNEASRLAKFKTERSNLHANDIPDNVRRHLFLLKSCGYNVPQPPTRGNQDVLSFDPYPPAGSRPRNFHSRLSDNTALNFILSFLPNFDPQNPPQYNSLAELIQDFMNFNHHNNGQQQ